MPGPLSNTERGKEWLQNFRAGPDRALARELVDSLSIISWSDARAALSAQIEHALTEFEGPTWILPVMATEDILMILNKPKGYQIVPFVNYRPGSGISSLPGSEAAIGNLVRAFVGRAGVLEPGASLADLRSAKVRTVLLVTDFIGTGKQVLEYVETLRRHGTLKSWLSFGWIKFVVVAYAASETAEQVLLSSSHVSKVRFVATAPTLSTLPWPSQKIATAISLCRRYPAGDGGLGYKDHGGLFVIQESVPNTIPQLFTHQSDSWVPMFDRRQMPAVLRAEVGPVYSPNVDLGQVANNFSQTRLAEALDRQMRDENRRILTLIALCVNRTGSLARIESALGVDRSTAERLVAYCIKSGWLEQSMTATESGRRELELGKRKERRVRTSPPLSPDSYYPRSLR